MAKKKKQEEQKKKFSGVSGLVADLNKHYGKKILRTGNDIPEIHKVPFDEPVLDYVSDGGIPIGRITELLGDTHSGKTRNALKVMGNFQRYCFSCHTPNALDVEWELDKSGMPQMKKCTCSNCDNPNTKVQVMVDIEGTTDPSFMEMLGIDPKGVIYTRPDMPSQAVGIVDAFLREPEVGLILLDSIGSMGSDKEVETAIEDEKMNQNALFFNKAMRKWQMALNANTNVTGVENGTTMIVVNQSYVTLSFYSTEVPQGGRGLRHGKGMSLKTRIKDKNKDSKTNEIKGVHIDFQNMKNKTGMPYRRKDYYLNLDPNHQEIAYCHTNINLQYIEMAIDMGIIEQRGGWYYFGTEKWQGKANLIENPNPDIFELVNKKLYQ